MTTLPAPTDALAESQRLIATIEQLRGELPFAEDILDLHRPTHHELETSATKSVGQSSKLTPPSALN